MLLSPAVNTSNRPAILGLGFRPFYLAGALFAVVAIVGADPAVPFELEARDVALSEDAVGYELGRLLPIVLVLLLISGGSFAALGAFAGEREGALRFFVGVTCRILVAGGALEVAEDAAGTTFAAVVSGLAQIDGKVLEHSTGGLHLARCKEAAGFV